MFHCLTGIARRTGVGVGEMISHSSEVSHQHNNNYHAYEENIEPSKGVELAIMALNHSRIFIITPKSHSRLRVQVARTVILVPLLPEGRQAIRGDLIRESKGSQNRRRFFERNCNPGLHHCPRGLQLLHRKRSAHVSSRSEHQGAASQRA